MALQEYWDKLINLFSLGELQIFFGIIAAGLIIYVLIFYTKPFFRLLVKFLGVTAEKTKGNFHAEIPKEEGRSYQIERTGSFEEEKPIEFRVDKVLFERVVFGIIILALIEVLILRIC